MPIKTNEREYRDFLLAVIPDSEESKTVKGYALTFNEPYTLLEDNEIVIQEQVDSRAFEGTDLSDVIMQYDHAGRVFARISNGTLKVEPDERGLAIEADLGGTDIGGQLYQEIKGGYTTKMSYSYTTKEDSWEQRQLDDGRILALRTIKSISKVYDVSAVSLPANNATSISARNLSDGVINEIKAERLKALELERNKLRLRMRLGGLING